MSDDFAKQQQMEQEKKIKNFDFLNKTAIKGQVLFTGSSLMEHFPICELCMNHGITKPIYNRAIGGYTTVDFINHIDTMLFDVEPSKVFINIGTNDINEDIFGKDWMELLLKNYDEILYKCKTRLPDTKVIMLAYYPVNDHVPNAPFFAKFMLKARTNENIEIVNEKMKLLAEKYNYEFINASKGLTDESGSLKEEFTVEGVHMYSNAYEIIFENIKAFI